MSTTSIDALVERLGYSRVLVVGDLILDRYVSGDVERISPEGPIPVLNARHREDRLGGAGNVAANLRALGAEVEVIGVLGNDSKGRLLCGMLEELGVETSGCAIDPTRPTTEKTRIIGGAQQVLRVDWEDSAPIEDAIAESIVADLVERVQRARALVLSDYGKGFLSSVLIENAIRIANENGIPVLVDPKGTDYARYRGAHLVTPNRKEAEEALGRSLAELDDLPAGADELIRAADLQAAVITLGAQGMFHLTRDGQSGHIPTVARAVFDVTGAGDTVISILALALAAGLDLGEAVQLANHGAGLVVAKRGACAVTRAELLEGPAGNAPGTGKVIDPTQLDHVLAEWRSRGVRVVFTNGCFDILHKGHVDYLRFARSKGDVLLVGVNDDDSVRRLKGPERPVNPIGDRLEVLAALEMVDGVVPFPEDTPKEIIERVTPKILVKGEDWKEKGVVGREWVERHGGEVHLAPIVPGRSTTSILDKARSGPQGS
jgi:D-beta-D-heptose 7-phosphate kinase/D-beta-D-heptose 1-phosphate adenosyltransferase